MAEGGAESSSGGGSSVWAFHDRQRQSSCGAESRVSTHIRMQMVKHKDLQMRSDATYGFQH